jgi:hypothetical protein
VVARLLIEHVQRVHLDNTRQQVDIPSPLAHRADLAVPPISTDLGLVEEIEITVVFRAAAAVQAVKFSPARAAIVTIVAAPAGKSHSIPTGSTADNHVDLTRSSGTYKWTQRSCTSCRTCGCYSRRCTSSSDAVCTYVYRCWLSHIAVTDIL